MIQNRILTISTLINENDCLADIGCDHGYLGIICKKKGIPFVQEIDNKKEPLLRAINNFKIANIFENVKFTCADGLSELDDCVNCVAICGMGGDLIVNILEKQIDITKRLNKLILQPNSKIPVLRKFLSDNSFMIYEEKIVYEKGKYYEILAAFHKKDCLKLNEEEILFGPIFLKNKSKLFIDKWKIRYDSIKSLVLNENVDTKLKKEYQMIQKLIKDVDYDKN